MPVSKNEYFAISNICMFRLKVLYEVDPCMKKFFYRHQTKNIQRNLVFLSHWSQKLDMLHDFAAGSWQLNHRGVYKRGSRRFPGERNLIDWGEVFDDLQNPFTCPLISLNLTICELKVWGTWFRATSHCGKGVLLEKTVIFFKWTLSKETLIQRNLNPKKPQSKETLWALFKKEL